MKGFAFPRSFRDSSLAESLSRNMRELVTFMNTWVVRFDDGAQNLTLPADLAVTGDVSAADGTFTGAVSGGSVSGGPVSGTTGTFTGAVSGTTGTFTGALSATTGTFSGAVDLTGGDLDMNDYDILGRPAVDQARAHTYASSVTITTAPQNLLALGLSGQGGVVGQVWEFNWGGYIESSIAWAGNWNLVLRSGLNTQYGQASRVFSQYHSGDSNGQGGAFGGSCIVTIDNVNVQISLTARSGGTGTQLANGLFIVGKRLT